MSHYFTNNEDLAHENIAIKFTLLGEEYTLKSDLGVFSKRSLDDGTRLLLETIAKTDLGKNILDVGCGVGPIGLILAHLDSERHVTMCDVNLRALELAKTNAKNLGLESRVEIVSSDVYRNINSTYDTIVSNPPIRAGKAVTYRIYDEAQSHLNDGGKLIIVIRKQQGAPSVYTHLSSLFSKVEYLESHKGYKVIIAYK